MISPKYGMISGIVALIAIGGLGYLFLGHFLGGPSDQAVAFNINARGYADDSTKVVHAELIVSVDGKVAEKLLIDGPNQTQTIQVVTKTEGAHSYTLTGTAHVLFLKEAIETDIGLLGSGNINIAKGDTFLVVGNAPRIDNKNVRLWLQNQEDYIRQQESVIPAGLLKDIIPGTRMEIIFMGIGVLVGLIYFSRWTGIGQHASISVDSRLLDLKYVLGFGAFSIISDLSKSYLAPEHSEYFLQLTSYYAEGVIGVIVLLFCLAFVAIAGQSALYWRKIRDHELELPIHPFYEFLKYGYEAYRASWTPIDSKLADLEFTCAEFREQTFKVAELLSVDMASLDRYHENPNENYRKELTQNVLRHICAMATPYMADDDTGEIRANIMCAYPLFEASENQLNRLRFHDWGDPQRYTHLLDLYYYDSGRPSGALALAVQSTVLSGAQEPVLPGAPCAFLDRSKMFVVEVGGAIFPEKIPDKIRKEINAYFVSQNFKCFVSYRMIKGDSVNGVINIESTNRSICDADEGDLKEFEKILQPFAVILGSLYSTRPPS